MNDNFYNYTSFILSLISVVIAFCAFIWPLIYTFLQRPRLNLLLDKVTYNDISSTRKGDFIRLLMINDGYRPIISECKFWTCEGGTCHYGIYDELKIPYGIGDIVLPVLIEPAKIEPAKTVFLNLPHPNNINKIIAISVYDSKRKEYKVSNDATQRIRAQINNQK